MLRNVLGYNVHSYLGEIQISAYTGSSTYIYLFHNRFHQELCEVLGLAVICLEIWVTGNTLSSK